MTKKRTFTLLSAAVSLAVLATILGLGGNTFLSFPTVTNAEQNSQIVRNNNLDPTGSFGELNQLAQAYKANPSLESAADLTSKVFNGVSILEIPESEKALIVNQVAAAHFNGSSNIQEADIAATINHLAEIADAPDFGYTNAAQVEVTRKYLSRLLPDVVSSNGAMNDLEAFTVFVGLLSQKIDNEDFMVAPDQFVSGMNNVSGSELPGNPSEGGQVVVTEETPQTYQMIEAINNYASSKASLSASDVITMLGIQ